MLIAFLDAHFRGHHCRQNSKLNCKRPQPLLLRLDLVHHSLRRYRLRRRSGHPLSVGRRLHRSYLIEADASGMSSLEYL